MSHFKYTDALGYSDATYVDSPSVMQYHNLVGYAKTLFDNETGRMTVPLHVKDLISKLSDSVYTLFPHADLFADSTYYNEALNISKKINNTFHGEVTYDTEQNEFFLEKKAIKLLQAI